ncbi:MAG: helix-turn-helix domain-containing protein [Exiguobacterium sp.]|nr:helix-turn-helix domain-containing protein [Exiguobacterium sp.]
MTFADRLRELRIRKNMTQGGLSKATGLTQSAIAMYETGKREPKIEVMELLADYFNVDMNYITGKTDKTTMLSASAIDAIDVIKIPLLGRVVAGDPQEAIQEADEFIYIPSMNHRRSDDYFALRVNGESMEPNLMDGDIAIVHIQPDVDSGQIAVVLIDNQDSTVKRVFITPDGITLVADNPAVFSPRFFTNDDCLTMPVKILGRVVSIQREM